MALASLLSLNEQYGQSIFNVNKFDKNGKYFIHMKKTVLYFQFDKMKF